MIFLPHFGILRVWANSVVRKAGPRCLVPRQCNVPGIRAAKGHDRRLSGHRPRPIIRHIQDPQASSGSHSITNCYRINLGHEAYKAVATQVFVHSDYKILPQQDGPNTLPQKLTVANFHGFPFTVAQRRVRSVVRLGSQYELNSQKVRIFSTKPNDDTANEVRELYRIPKSTYCMITIFITYALLNALLVPGAAEQDLSRQPSAELVHQTRELLQLTRRHRGVHSSMASEKKNPETWSDIEGIVGRMMKIYRGLMPRYPWNRQNAYHLYRSWIGLLKANALLQEIIIADAKSEESQWSDEERRDLARYLRSDRRLLMSSFMLAHIFVGALAAGVRWAAFGRRRAV